MTVEQSEKLRSMIRGMVRELKSMNALYPVKDGQTFKPTMPQEIKP